MKYNIQTRGANTKDRWEKSHQQGVDEWEKYSGKELDNIIRNNWYHYNYVMDNVVADRSTFKYNKILDVGCGPNKCLIYYAEKFPDLKFTGIDFTDTVVEFGKKYSHIKNINFKKVDFLEEEIYGNYDVISMLETLEHTEPETNFKIVRDLVTKCKYLYVSVPLDNDPNGGEHISFYDFNSFNEFDVLERSVVFGRGRYIVNSLEESQQIKINESHVFMFKIKGKL